MIFLATRECCVAAGFATHEIGGQANPMPTNLHLGWHCNCRCAS
jgi:hypothetical protein